MFGAIGKGLGAIINPITGAVSGRDQQQADLDRYLREEKEIREKGKRSSLSHVDQMRGPEMTAQNEARIRALEEESKDAPLVEDKYFQGQRAAVVQGGQQALSSVQNQRLAHGTSGGFSNQGSISDVYDRLGGSLAQLGAQSAALKDQKRDQAAQARQEFMDSQIEFENAQRKLKIAIEQGDTTAAMQALEMARQSRAQMAQMQTQITGGMISGAAAAFGKKG